MAEYSAGEARVRLVPDASRFLAETRSKLAAIKDPGFPVHVTPEFDSAKIDAWRKEQQAKGVKEDVDVETKGASTHLDEWRRKEQANDVNVKVNVDTARARGEVAALRGSVNEFSNSLTSFGNNPFTKTLSLAVFQLPLFATGLAEAAASMQQLAQAALAVPGGITAAVASIGTLAFGVSGVKQAWDDAGAASLTSGKDQAQSAQQAVAASNALRNAIVDEGRARKDVGQAIRDARNDLRDLNVEMRGGLISESRAILEAQRAREDFASGNYSDIRDAKLRVLEADQRLLEVRSRNTESAQKLNDAESKGVSGSDKVTSANENLIRALQQTASAQAAATAALSSGGTAADKAAESMGKLAPNAREFVQAMIGLKDGPIKDLRDFNQQKIFAGLAADATQAFATLAPTLTKGTGAISDAWNKTFKTLFTTIGKDQNKSLIDRILGNTAEAQNRLTGVIDPLVTGVGTLAAAGTDALPRVADALKGVADRFADFITEADQNGSLKKWIDEGLTAFGHLSDAVFNVGRIFTSITQAANGDWLQKLDTFTQKWADFFSSTEGQNKIKEFFAEGRAEFEQWKPILEALPGIFQGVLAGAQTYIKPLVDILKPITEFLSSQKALVGVAVAAWLTWSSVTTVVNTVANAVKGLATALGTAEITGLAAGAAGAGAKRATLPLALRGGPIATLLLALGYTIAYGDVPGAVPAGTPVPPAAQPGLAAPPSNLPPASQPGLFTPTDVPPPNPAAPGAVTGKDLKPGDVIPGGGYWVNGVPHRSDGTVIGPNDVVQQGSGPAPGVRGGGAAPPASRPARDLKPGDRIPSGWYWVNGVLHDDKGNVVDGNLPVPGFQTGGGIPGYGGGDKVPILVEGGEHVFDKDDVRAMGGQQAVTTFRQHLHGYQTGGPIPQSGGQVAIPDPAGMHGPTLGYVTAPPASADAEAQLATRTGKYGPFAPNLGLGAGNFNSGAQLDTSKFGQDTLAGVPLYDISRKFDYIVSRLYGPTTAEGASRAFERNRPPLKFNVPGYITGGVVGVGSGAGQGLDPETLMQSMLRERSSDKTALRGILTAEDLQAYTKSRSETGQRLHGFQSGGAVTVDENGNPIGPGPVGPAPGGVQGTLPSIVGQAVSGAQRPIGMGISLASDLIQQGIAQAGQQADTNAVIDQIGPAIGGFQTGGPVVNPFQNPVLGPAPGPPASVDVPAAPDAAAPAPGGGLLGGFLSGLGVPGLGGNSSSGGTSLKGAAAIPGLFGLAAIAGQPGDQSASLMQWGTQTAQWLGQFTANFGMKFGTTLLQGVTSGLGIDTSYLQDAQKVASHFGGLLGDLTSGDTSGDIVDPASLAPGYGVDYGQITSHASAGTPTDASGSGSGQVPDWDATARGESGGNWNQVFGTGVPEGGGLQIKPGTWEMYGGKQFADKPYLATKAQQITVAERILNGWNGVPGQGAKAWEAWGGYKTGTPAPGIGGAAGSGGVPTLTAGNFDAVDAIASQRFGLQMTSGYRDPNGPTVAGVPANQSYHGSGRAHDYSGDPASMLAFANYMAATFGPQLKEEIFSAPGFSSTIKDGQIKGPFGAFYTLDQAGNHSNHVHIAYSKGGPVNRFDRGGFLPPGLSTVYNGLGHPEPVIPLNPADVPGFQVGGPITPELMAAQIKTAAAAQPVGPVRGPEAKTIQPQPAPTPRPTPAPTPQPVPAQPIQPTAPTAPGGAPSIPAGPAPLAPPPPEFPIPGTPPPPPGPTAAAPDDVTASHNLAWINKGIESGASALGTALATAMGVGGGFVPGLGAAAPYAAGLVQQGGKIVEDAANVVSSFLVGNVPGSGTTTASASGDTLRPQQRQLAVAAANGNTRVASYGPFYGHDTRSVMQEINLHESMEEQTAFSNRGLRG